MKLWSSKTKLLCETSFKNEALKLKNEAFVRDFLQKRSFEDQKRSLCARLPSKMKLRTSKTKHFYETSFKNDMLTARLTSELQYVLAIFKWMLQKYCACHEKVEPRHTKVTATRNDHCKVTLPWHELCNPSTDSASEASTINIAKREIPAPATRNASFPSLFKSTTPANVFCNPHELLLLPRILKRIEIPAPATRKALWASKSGPRTWCFNDFDFQIVLARRRGANFSDFNFQKCSDAVSFLTILTSKSCWRAGVVQILATSTSKSAPIMPIFNDFDFQIVLARRRGANFADFNFQKCSDHASFWRFWLPNRAGAQAWCKFCRILGHRSSAPARS